MIRDVYSGSRTPNLDFSVPDCFIVSFKAPARLDLEMIGFT